MPTMPTVAQALWPTLRSTSPEALAREAAQARDKEWRERDRERLLRHLRELNASLRADREKGR